MNILGLMDYRIFTIDENEHDFHIQAELITSPSCCAHCGHPKIHRHEVKPQLYMDIPIRNKHVGIIVQRKRYLCWGCRRTFFETLPHMHAYHFMTKLLVREGRGFSFEVIRAKVLLTNGLRKETRPGYDRAWEASVPSL